MCQRASADAKACRRAEKARRSRGFSPAARPRSAGITRLAMKRLRWRSPPLGEGAGGLPGRLVAAGIACLVGHGVHAAAAEPASFRAEQEHPIVGVEDRLDVVGLVAVAQAVVGLV